MSNPMILIVDGHRERALAVAESFGESFDCVTTTTAHDALVVIRESRPLAVVVDFPFPTEDGRCLSAGLGEDPSTSEIPLVAYSAWDFSNTRAKASALGCDAFVPRADGPGAVARAVVELISERSQSAA